MNRKKIVFSIALETQQTTPFPRLDFCFFLMNLCQRGLVTLHHDDPIETSNTASRLQNNTNKSRCSVTCLDLVGVAQFYHAPLLLAD